MTPDEKAELREAAEAATPGPWRVHGPCCGLVLTAIGPIVDAFMCADNRENNKAFIVAANPATVLALLDENARLAAEVERLKTWTNVDDALPDSDVSVVATNDHSEYVVVQLEFTDDSEGHGEPYWASDGGDFSLQRYRRWMPLPDPPKGDTDG